jgi:hypothetical protein
MMKIDWLFQPGFVARQTEVEEKEQWLRKQPVLQISVKRGILCHWFQGAGCVSWITDLRRGHERVTSS